MLEFLASELTRHGANPALADDGLRLRRAGEELVTLVRILGDAAYVMPQSALQEQRSVGGFVGVRTYTTRHV
jgi:hypothetical protein